MSLKEVTDHLKGVQHLWSTWVGTLLKINKDNITPE